LGDYVHLLLVVDACLVHCLSHGYHHCSSACSGLADPDKAALPYEFAAVCAIPNIDLSD